MRILTKPTASNGLIVFKLKLDLKYRGHVYCKTVHPHIIYKTFNCLKSHNNFYEDISNAKGLSNEEMSRFSDILEIQGENEGVTEKIISDGKEMSESINTEI